MASLAQGRIIRAKVPDPQGRNPKQRNLIIVTPTDEIEHGETVQCVAVTSQVDQSPDDVVLLPWAPQGRCVTKLSKRCGALCTWVIEISKDEIAKFGGFVPPATIDAIEEKLRELRERLDF